MHTLQGNFLHVQHVNLCPKVVEDAGLLTRNVASTHNHHPAPNICHRRKKTANLHQIKAAHMPLPSSPLAD